MSGAEAEHVKVPGNRLQGRTCYGHCTSKGLLNKLNSGPIWSNWKQSRIVHARLRTGRLYSGWTSLVPIYLASVKRDVCTETTTTTTASTSTTPTPATICCHLAKDTEASTTGLRTIPNSTTYCFYGGAHQEIITHLTLYDPVLLEWQWTLNLDAPPQHLT